MKKLVLAIDFDETIVHSDFPTILEFREGAKKYIKKLHDDGHLIMINTCRTKKADMKACGMDENFSKEACQEEVATFLWQEGVPFHGINIQSYPATVLYTTSNFKMFADVYIDEKNLHVMAGAAFDWKTIYELVTKIANESTN